MLVEELLLLLQDCKYDIDEQSWLPCIVLDDLHTVLEVEHL